MVVSFKVPINNLIMNKDRSVILLWIAILGDAIAASLGMVISHWVRFQSGVVSFDDSWWTSGGGRASSPLSNYFGLLVVGLVLLLGTFFSMNLYCNKNFLRFRSSALVVTRAVSLWLMIYLGVSLVLKFNPSISRVFAVLSAIFAWIFILCWRFTLIKATKAFGVASWLTKRVAFFGWSDAADRLVKSIEQESSDNYLIAGVILDSSQVGGSGSKTMLPILGGASDLAQILGDQGIDILVRSDGPWDVEHLIGLSNLCDRGMVQFKMIPSRLHSMIAGLHLETISDVPILGVVEGPLADPLNRFLKRAVDIVGALVGLVVCVPVVCVFGILVYLESPGPIIYRQLRTGRRGKVFQILKIRSMRLDAEVQGGAQWAKKGTTGG